MPIWSSHIQKIAIRNMDGFLLKKQFPATYEAFVFDAITLAEETLLAIDTNLDPAILSQFDKKENQWKLLDLMKKSNYRHPLVQPKN